MGYHETEWGPGKLGNMKMVMEFVILSRITLYKFIATKLKVVTKRSSQNHLLKIQFVKITEMENIWR